MRAIVALLLASCLWPGAAHAELRWGFTPSAGGVLLDSKLDDYRWDVNPRAAWAIESWVSRGAFEAGLALDRAVTHQGTGIPGESFSPEVRLTTLALRARWAPGRWWGIEPFGQFQVGRMHVGWSPDRAELDVLGGAEPIAVRYEPLDAWRMGAGLGLRHWVHPRLALGLLVERTSFAMQTTHRNGNEIEQRDERFGNWQWGVQMSFAPRGSR